MTVLGVFIKADVLLNLLQRPKYKQIDEAQAQKRQHELIRNRQGRAAPGLVPDVGIDAREIVGQADEGRAPGHRAQIGVIVHIVAGLGQMALVVPRISHGFLLAFIVGHGNYLAQRIDFQIVGAAHCAGIGRAEKEILRLVRIVGQYAEQEIDVIRTLDLIDAGDQPGIGDLRAELLILLRQRLDLLC